MFILAEYDEQGRLVITIKDIYKQQNELSDSVNKLSRKFDTMTSTLNTAVQIESISREALETAENAERKANIALENDKKDEERRIETRNIWTKALLATILPWLFTLIGGLVALTKGGVL